MRRLIPVHNKEGSSVRHKSERRAFNRSSSSRTSRRVRRTKVCEASGTYSGVPRSIGSLVSPRDIVMCRRGSKPRRPSLRHSAVNGCKVDFCAGGHSALTRSAPKTGIPLTWTACGPWLRGTRGIEGTLKVQTKLPPFVARR
jgi:hypothetical protein